MGAFSLIPGGLLQSGAIEAEEKITLTSTLSKDAEISQAMHEKLMRLIKAMIPNSTTEQKDSFIRDLFEMGLRVNSNSSVRVQTEERLNAEKESQSSLDDFMIDASNSILASSNENSMRQKPNRIVNPYLDEGLKLPILAELVDFRRQSSAPVSVVGVTDRDRLSEPVGVNG